MRNSKYLVINSREKILSPDINNGHALVLRSAMEIVRAAYLNTHNGASDVQAVATAAPLRALVLSGLCVLPQDGSFDLYVSAGAVVMAETPASAYDSPASLVTLDADMATPGALTISANASGSTRVDLIEVARADATFATETRDVYDPVTATFNPTSVPKILGSSLVFRVRAGVPGSGLPASASGWLPLAVAIVPTGVASNNGIAFYDVRPLLEDLVDATAHTTGLGDGEDYRWIDSTYYGTFGSIQGHFTGVLRGARVGGPIGETDADIAPLDVTAPANQQASLVWPTSTFAGYLYVTFPGGLPRWARYTEGGPGRRPGRFNGYPVVSPVVPLETSISSGPITLPFSLGTARGYQFGFFAAATAGFGIFASATSVEMVRKRYTEFGGLMSDAGLNFTSLAANPVGSLPVPANTRRVGVVWGTTYSGLATNKAIAFSRTLFGTMRQHVTRYTGGSQTSVTEHESPARVVGGVLPIFGSVVAENLTDATALGAGSYEHLISTTSLEF